MQTLAFLETCTRLHPLRQGVHCPSQSVMLWGNTGVRGSIESPGAVQAYSLHRKLSGTFLTCIKLGALVPCRQLFLDTYTRAKAAARAPAAA